MLEQKIVKELEEFYINPTVNETKAVIRSIVGDIEITKEVEDVFRENISKVYINKIKLYFSSTLQKLFLYLMVKSNIYKKFTNFKVECIKDTNVHSMDGMIKITTSENLPKEFVDELERRSKEYLSKVFLERMGLDSIPTPDKTFH